METGINLHFHKISSKISIHLDGHPTTVCPARLMYTSMYRISIRNRGTGRGVQLHEQKRFPLLLRVRQRNLAISFFYGTFFPRPNQRLVKCKVCSVDIKHVGTTTNLIRPNQAQLQLPNRTSMLRLCL